MIFILNLLSNSHSIFNQTPLHIASFEGHREIVEILIQQPGIDINCKEISNFLFHEIQYFINSLYSF